MVVSPITLIVLSTSVTVEILVARDKLNITSTVKQLKTRSPPTMYATAASVEAP